MSSIGLLYQGVGYILLLYVPKNLNISEVDLNFFDNNNNNIIIVKKQSNSKI